MHLQDLSIYIMAAFYSVIGLSHFFRPNFYLELIPQKLPFPKILNVLTGIIETTLAILLLFEKTRLLAVWGIIFLLLGTFPFKIYLYQSRGTNTPWLMRWPIQLLLVIWAGLHT